MRLAPLLAVSFVACGAAPAAAPTTPPPAAASPDWLVAAEAGVAPRPYTGAQIRDAMPVGSELRYRIEEQGKPAHVLVMTVTASDETNGTLAGQKLAEDGTLLEEQAPSSAEWDALARHATFPEAATTVRQATIDSPAGTFAGVEYVVRADDGSVKTYRFARELPGPPIVMFVEKDGALVTRMTLLSRN